MTLHTRKLMMKVTGGLLVVVGLLMFTGCFTLSVHPFYQQDDVVWEAGLLGVWGDPEDSVGETWQFLSAGENAYQLVIRKENSLRINPHEDGVFTAHLFRLNGLLYMDLFPDEPTVGSDFFISHVVPAHSVWQVELAGGLLGLKILESEAFEKAVTENRLQIDYIERDNVQVLTSSSDDLRAMLMQHGSDFFGDSETMQRIQ